MGKAYLSLGSNIEAEKNLASAVSALRARFGALVLSPLYRTAALRKSAPSKPTAAVR